MFDGIYHVDFDDLGRLALPEPWRHNTIRHQVILMPAKVVLNRDCLRAFAPMDFGPMANKLRLKRSEPFLGSLTLMLLGLALITAPWMQNGGYTSARCLASGTCSMRPSH
jgi:DNA-binding transcriptional regulator/RsmH inhibitor MraZ